MSDLRSADRAAARPRPEALPREAPLAVSPGEDSEDTDTCEVTLTFEDNRAASVVLGQYDQNLAKHAYWRGMRSHELVFAEGPAGTGKTWLAVGYAVSLLEQGKVERLVLSRPALEAGERLGFLPGDMREKVDPYLRPIYDALQD